MTGKGAGRRLQDRRQRGGVAFDRSNLHKRRRWKEDWYPCSLGRRKHAPRRLKRPVSKVGNKRREGENECDNVGPGVGE